MKISNVKSYLEANYLDFIKTQRGEPYFRAFTEIAKDLLQIDKSLENVPFGSLRKNVSLVHQSILVVSALTSQKQQNNIPLLHNTTNRLTDYITQLNLPKENLAQAKFVNHNGQEKFNITYDFNAQGAHTIALDKIDEVIAKMVSGTTQIKRKNPADTKSITDRVRFIIADTHIGMDPSEDGKSLYGGIWNKQELFSRLQIVVDDMLDHSKKFVHLDFLDLGDYLDGWNNSTTRGGHRLKQNMTNEEMFEVGVEAKIFVLDAISKHYKSITMYNVCNDNHAGSFGYVVNHAVAEIAKIKYANVTVYNKKKFINHYATDTHAWVYMHGKDEEIMKYGFPLVKDQKAAEKIDDYLKAHNLFGRGLDITIEKADLHQTLLDWSSEDYDYNTYPAFCPSSNYLQTNYRKGKSGYVRQTVQNGQKDTSIKWFKWNSNDSE